VLLERAIENDANVNETLRQLVPYVDRSLAANKPIYKMDEAFNALNESLLEVKVYGNLFTFCYTLMDNTFQP
jgi:ABC-type proline/glycine betaine transport system ATPase subunit